LGTVRADRCKALIGNSEGRWVQGINCDGSKTNKTNFNHIFEYTF
jgi:hypothetical protein